VPTKNTHTAPALDDVLEISQTCAVQISVAFRLSAQSGSVQQPIAPAFRLIPGAENALHFRGVAIATPKVQIRDWSGAIFGRRERIELDIGTKEEAESTQRGPAADGSWSPLEEERFKAPRKLIDML
jgi:hypothetical protein